MNAERERDELRSMVATFLDRAQDLTAVRQALETGHDRGTWQRMVTELGLPAIGLPEAVGGTGASLSDLVVVTEELGRHLDPGPFFSHAVLGLRMLVAAGADAATVAGLVEGEATIAVALPDAEGDAPGATGTVSGQRVTVTGHLRDVIHGADADELLAVARTSAGTSVVRLPLGAPGVTVTPLSAVDQTRPLADVELVGVEADLVGQPGAAAGTVGQVLRDARIALAAEQVGVAAGALDLTVAYAQERHQFGRAIGSFQSIKHLLVDVMMEIEAARTAVRHAAGAVDRGEADLEELSLLCQAVASDAAFAAGKAAVQVHGAIGFTWEHDAHLFLKRAMGDHQLLGTPRQHRQWLAELLLDRPGTTTGAPAPVKKG